MISPHTRLFYLGSLYALRSSSTPSNTLHHFTMSDLSAYEIARLQRIKENKAVIAKIGLKRLKTLPSNLAAKAAATIKKRERAKRNRKRKATLPPAVGSRRSKRILDKLQKDSDSTSVGTSRSVFYCSILVPLLATLTWWLLTTQQGGCTLCEQWAKYDASTLPNDTVWMNSVPKCPCTTNEIVNNHLFVEDRVPALHNPCSATYDQPGCTMSSFRTIDVSVPHGAGNQCCYDKKGLLVTKGLSAGTVDRFSPVGLLGTVRHVLHDVVPFIFCCHMCHSSNSDGDGSECMCDTYTQKRRPLVSEDGCQEVESEYVC